MRYCIYSLLMTQYIFCFRKDNVDNLNRILFFLNPFMALRLIEGSIWSLG